MPEDLPTSKKSLKQLEKEKSISERFANVGKIVQKDVIDHQNIAGIL